jgi:hypothetical protein
VLQVHLSFLLEICLTRYSTCYMLRPVDGSSAMRGRLGLMCEPTAVGRQPHIHIERYRDWRLAHESKRFYPK